MATAMMTFATTGTGQAFPAAPITVDGDTPSPPPDLQHHQEYPEVVGIPGDERKGQSNLSKDILGDVTPIKTHCIWEHKGWIW